MNLRFLQVNWIGKGGGKMKNPLNKRLPREFKGEFAKYLSIFLFMTATIGFVSGFLVAGSSMMRALKSTILKMDTLSWMKRQMKIRLLS